jgi:Spy/CpxP family protein refolding chaperone
MCVAEARFEKRTRRDDTTRGKEKATMTISRMTRWTAALAVAGILITGLALAAAQEEPQGSGYFGPRMMGPRGMPVGGGLMHGRMLRQLDLTDEQQEKLREFMKSHFEKTMPERDALMNARKELHQAINTAVEAGEVMNKGDIESLGAAAAVAEADLAVAQSIIQKDFLADLASTLNLTTEQQEKLEELRAEGDTFRGRRPPRRKNLQ